MDVVLIFLQNGDIFDQLIFLYHFYYKPLQVFVMNDSAQIVECINKVNKTLKIVNHPNPRELKIDNPDLYPNNLICCIKFKLFKKEVKVASIYGTGCLIGQNYVLTAAHNIQKVLMEYTELTNRNKEYRIQGYVKESLHEGKQKNKYIINLDKAMISKNYLQKVVNNQFPLPTNQIKLKYQDYDYGLLHVIRIEGEKEEQAKFPPLVAIKEAQSKCIEEVSLYGYAHEINKISCDIEDKSLKRLSSLFMQSMYGGKDKITHYTAKNLKYEIPTDMGVSGGPIITQLSQPSIIGIHKCTIKNVYDDEKANAGVSTLLMMEQVNDWAHQLIKRPFVFTKSTLYLRNSIRIGKNGIFSLLNHNLDYLDMHVINGFDLSVVKKIILSGNKIGDQGVRIFLKRNYPSLQSLFLSENEIYSLSKVSKEGWSHIKSVKNLSLSVNYLKELPEEIVQLVALQKLQLTYNTFSSIPKILFDFKKEKFIVVSLYQNNFKTNDQTEIKEALHAKNIQLILNKYQK